MRLTESELEAHMMVLACHHMSLRAQPQGLAPIQDASLQACAPPVPHRHCRERCSLLPCSFRLPFLSYSARRAIEDLPLLAASALRAALPAVWNVPYPRNPFFLGRDNLLSRLRSQLQRGQITALSQPMLLALRRVLLASDLELLSTRDTEEPQKWVKLITSQNDHL